VVKGYLFMEGKMQEKKPSVYCPICGRLLRVHGDHNQPHRCKGCNGIIIPKKGNPYPQK